MTWIALQIANLQMFRRGVNSFFFVFYLRCGLLDNFDTCVLRSPSLLWPCTVTLLLSIHLSTITTECDVVYTEHCDIHIVLLLLLTSLPLFVERSPAAPTICCEVTFSQVMSSLLVVVSIETCHCDTNRHCSEYYTATLMVWNLFQLGITSGKQDWFIFCGMSQLKPSLKP